MAGLILVSILTGMGYYGPRREKPCGCKDKSCTISEPLECTCCDKKGGCVDARH